MGFDSFPEGGDSVYANSVERCLAMRCAFSSSEAARRLVHCSARSRMRVGCPLGVCRYRS